MIWVWFASPFIHTPPHPAGDSTWNVTYVRREQMTPKGMWCAWEAESLMAGDRAIWSAEAPEEENWCKQPGESARMVDVLGSDGPFVSVHLVDWGCCPERTTETRCVTYDVRTGETTTLEAYDPKSWKWRQKRIAQVSKRKYGGALTYEPSAFIVGDGHIKVCGTVDGAPVDVPLR